MTQLLLGLALGVLALAVGTALGLVIERLCALRSARRVERRAAEAKRQTERLTDAQVVEKINRQ